MGLVKIRNHHINTSMIQCAVEGKDQVNIYFYGDGKTIQVTSDEWQTIAALLIFPHILPAGTA
jgi:hypothetical protein